MDQLTVVVREDHVSDVDILVKRFWLSSLTTIKTGVILALLPVNLLSKSGLDLLAHTALE